MKPTVFNSAWITKKKNIEILQKDLLELKSRDIRVKVKACGICGTDIHFYRDYPNAQPMPLGHEVAGLVEQTGKDVTNVKVGDRVVIQNNIACGVCAACLNQKPQACSGIITYMDDQSAMAEYLTVPDIMAVKYDGLGFTEASLAEPLTVSLDLWREASISFGDDVLIIGPGIIGLGMVKLASASGARNTVLAGRRFDTPRGGSREHAAAVLGASTCIDTADANWKKNLQKFFPEGFNKVIITAPPVVIPDGIELAGFGADIIYNGISFTDDELSLSANELHFQKKHLKTSHAIPNWGFPIALDLLKSGTINPELLLTDRFAFNDIEAAFKRAQAADKAVIKVVLEF